jgi:hypothetical protein
VVIVQGGASRSAAIREDRSHMREGVGLQLSRRRETLAECFDVEMDEAFERFCSYSLNDNVALTSPAESLVANVDDFSTL